MHLVQIFSLKNSNLFLPRSLTSWPIHLLMFPYIYIFFFSLLFHKTHPLGRFSLASVFQGQFHGQLMSILGGQSEPTSTYQTKYSISHVLDFSFFFRLLICDTSYSHRYRSRKGWCYDLGELRVLGYMFVQFTHAL